MDAVSALSALGDATRRRVYEHVSSQAAGVSREEVAAATGIARTLAAYHLDRLATEGLLTVTYERRSGRTGPGAGRPAKFYARSEREVTVSVPPRDYHLAARLLAEAAATDTDGQTRRALCRAAEDLGREVAREAGHATELQPLLSERGYEPYLDDDAIRLRNCPFHAVAQRHPEVVCEMNLALLRGVLAERPELTAMLEPSPGRCCVALRTAAGDR
jgi:predicted ArsR family transcriptional regulator